MEGICTVQNVHRSPISVVVLLPGPCLALHVDPN